MHRASDYSVTGQNGHTIVVPMAPAVVDQLTIVGSDLDMANPIFTVTVPPESVDVDAARALLHAIANGLACEAHEIKSVSRVSGIERSYGMEHVFCLYSKRPLCFGQSFDYVRLVDNGVEVAYWTAEELAEEPQRVLGCLTGALLCDFSDEGKCARVA